MRRRDNITANGSHNFGRPCSPASEHAFLLRDGEVRAMSSKVFAPVHPASVKTLIFKLEGDSTSLITLRVKRDRRQFTTDVPAAFDRRGARQPLYTQKTASN